MRRWTAAILAGMALALWAAAPALAHVTVSPTEASGGFQKLTFRVPHGCEGSPTVRVTVQIPAGVASVTPQVNPGWEISVTEGELPEPVEVHGETVTEGITAVTWEGGPLPDAYLDEFGLSVFIAAEAGETIYFPVIQECTEGEHRWIQIPAEGESAHDLPEPAPAVVLTAGGDHGHGAETVEGSHAEGDAPEVTAELAELRSQVAALKSALSEQESPPAPGGPDPLTVAALVVGALGLVAGGSALVVTRRR